MCCHHASQLSHVISLNPLKNLAGEQVLLAHIEEIKPRLQRAIMCSDHRTMRSKSEAWLRSCACCIANWLLSQEKICTSSASRDAENMFTQPNLSCG